MNEDGLENGWNGRSKSYSELPSSNQSSTFFKSSSTFFRVIFNSFWNKLIIYILPWSKCLNVAEPPGAQLQRYVPNILQSWS